MSEQRPVRIANCSGFYGDRFSAALEMVEGGPIDVLTGDYLAELTMLVLWKARKKDSGGGYAKTFLSQMEQILGTCLDRGIRVVTNAGGLNPVSLRDDLVSLAHRIGLAPRIAYIQGDDLIDRVDELIMSGHTFANLDTGQPLADAGVEPVTANAYLGGWGIVEALGAGADIVVCPRVTDASLVLGPAAWWHGWAHDDFDALAGAVVAGHVIECGPQATGGNYPWIEEIVDRRLPGFPIAEVSADGSAVITKHPGTGGLVSRGTVTAQLLYEIAEPAYANPDVTAHFDTVSLCQEDVDRVRIFGVRGTPPTENLKVALNYFGGYRNSMTLVLTGLDIEEKAGWAEAELFASLGGKERFREVDVRLERFDHENADTNELATAHLQITVKDSDPLLVGRVFSNAVMELALSSYPGFFTTSPPTAGSAYGVFWPSLIPVGLVEQRVVLPDGTVRLVPHTAGGAADSTDPDRFQPNDTGSPMVQQQSTQRVPLGRICGARSGDKGGNANVGLWTRDPVSYAWLREEVTVETLRELIPEAHDLTIHRYELSNLMAVNFVIVGLLGEGVASSTRPDPQAKGLGEYLRSRFVDVPVSLLN
ncbi:acyclic terpene utilization AtuA family protein [Ferrimicrobium sp.]|uniref:acyclic terpene utilization AtuA family protein n=1 Tax=Ferrimicrobium sp. TaxID=2926050 RepID=UPI00261E9599|nr:acyclic terpene utilization AtuA family protein [Ferrimicrobium sp.]